MTHPATPYTTTARIVATDPDGPQGPLTPYVEVDGQRWPIPAAASPYELVNQLYKITGKWHIIPEPKPLHGGPRLPARNAHVDNDGALVVDVEEVHPPEG